MLEHRWSELKGSSDSIKDPATDAILAAHGFWRDSTRGALGVFGQYGHERVTFGDDLSELSSTMENVYLGGEGQLFLQNVTLYGQVAYHQSQFDQYVFSLDGKGVVLTGQMRFFIQPNLSFALKALYDRQSVTASGGSGDLTQTSWGLGARAEYQLTSMPLTLFSEVSYGKTELETDGGGDLTTETTRVMVGLKYHFGGRSLLDVDRSGASFDPIESPASIFIPFI